MMDVTVREGDTLDYYSQLFDVPLSLIIDSNRQTEPQNLKIGECVRIPGFIAVNYTVRPGDTLWKLAQQKNIDVDALILLNQQVNPLQLPIGELICLPERITTRLMNRKTNYSFDVLQKDLKQLIEIYPFIRQRIIGKSVDGRPLYELVIGRGKRKVHMNGSFHANEWITTPVLMTFINDYVLSLTNSQPIREVVSLPLYEKNTISAVPMVNPDGVNLVLNGPPLNKKDELLKLNKGSTDFSGWKANIRGVDLNNQYPAKWEIESKRKEEKAPAPRDFPGYKPLSEPEAIAMAQLANQSKFDRLLALHTQGKEFYWGYEGLEPEESAHLAKRFEQVCGYCSVRYVDSYAGYRDWFIQEYRKSGFTIELGKGMNPLPLSQFDQIYEEVLGIFLVSLYD
jgi:g-D-glutamyl-meso-diaminopimelate peptidase